MPRRNGKKKKTAVKSRFHLLGYERELAEYSRAELKRIILQHSSETAIPSAKASRVSKADELLAPKLRAMKRTMKKNMEQLMPLMAEDIINDMIQMNGYGIHDISAKSKEYLRNNVLTGRSLVALSKNDDLVHKAGFGVEEAIKISLFLEEIETGDLKYPPVRGGRGQDGYGQQNNAMFARGRGRGYRARGGARGYVARGGGGRGGARARGRGYVARGARARGRGGGRGRGRGGGGDNVNNVMDVEVEDEEEEDNDKEMEHVAKEVEQKENSAYGHSQQYFQGYSQQYPHGGYGYGEQPYGQSQYGPRYHPYQHPMHGYHGFAFAQGQCPPGPYPSQYYPPGPPGRAANSNEIMKQKYEEEVIGILLSHPSQLYQDITIVKNSSMTQRLQAVMRKAKYSGVKDPNAKTAGLRLGKLIWKETGWVEIAGTMDDGKLVKIDGSTEKAKDVIETTSSDLARNQRSQHGGHDRYWLLRMNPVTIWNESDADAQKRQKEFAQKHSIRMGHWIDIHFGQTVVAEAASLGLMDHEQNKEPNEAGNEKEQNDGALWDQLML